MNVYERDWDVLIILDACRVDAMREVSGCYSFIDDVETIISLGSTSKEWIGKNFTEEFEANISDTTYICGNPHLDAFQSESLNFLESAATTDTRLANANWPDRLISSNVVGTDRFARFVPLWSELSERSDYGAVEAEGVTDCAINAARNSDSDRLIIHYMQPHSPYIASAKREGRELHEYEESPFEYLRNGGSKDAVWDSYIDNLRYVLDSVEVLLNNMDADRVVISADHGELFDEFGPYGHGPGIFHPKLRTVSWVRTTASDTGEYRPDPVESESDGDIREHLEDLGYL